jgi:uncharacterized protein
VAIKIADLSSQPRIEHARLSTAWCADRMAGVYRALEDEQAATVTATRTAEVVEVKVETAGAFGFDCSRCAEPSRLQVEVAFTHHFVGPGQLDAGADWGTDEAADADPDVSEHDGVRIELDELCIEHTILALSDVPLCRDDCRGLCPQCGTNRNLGACSCAPDTDARSPWTALRDFKLSD